MKSTHWARLLSGRGEPSVLEKEQLFVQLQRRRVAQRGNRWSLQGLLEGWRASWVTLGATLAVAAAMGLALVLKSPMPTSGRILGFQANEFTSRGSASVSAPSVRLICLRASREATCSIGATLAFEFEQLPDLARYYAAFARAADGTILWYSPEPGGKMPAVDRSRSMQRWVVELLPPHAPGTYDVYALFAREAMTRDELRGLLDPSLTSNSRVLIVKRQLELRGQP